jgi:hypothetical protein
MSAGNLKNMLKAHSPLSDEVLTTYINSSKSNIPGQFKEVMSPNLPVSDEVKPLFDNKLNSMPPGIAQQLRVLQANNPAYRTLTAVKDDIERATVEKQLYQNDLVSQYLDNNMEAEAVALLENEDNEAAYRSLLDYYLTKYDAVQADQKLALLQNSESPEFISINEMLVRIATDSLSPFALDSAEIEEVRNIAAMGYITPEVCQARAVLWLLYGEEFDYPDTESESMNKSAALNTGKKDITAFNEYLLGNSPNPVANRTTVWYQLPAYADNAGISIFDAAGRKVKTYLLPVEENSLEIDVSDMPGGVYTYSLLINNTVFESRKMIVIK